VSAETSLARLAREKLEAALRPELLEITDDSHRHAGHGGAGGGGHLRVRVVSSEFKNLGLLERHRLIYGILAEEMKSGRLHAVAVDEARSPGESVK